MRFVLLYKSGKPETSDSPSPQEIQAVGTLVQEMAQAGRARWCRGFRAERDRRAHSHQRRKVHRERRSVPGWKRALGGIRQS